MPTNIITGLSAAVGAGGNVDVQPPVGQAYRMIDFTNNAAMVADVPDVEVRLRDGTLADAIILIDPTTNPGRRIRPVELYITRDNYCRIVNTGGAGSNIGYFGELVNALNVRADLVTIGAGANVNIQPPAGESWKITCWGASTWTVAGDLNPSPTIRVTNGTLILSAIVRPTMVRGQDKIAAWYINNTIYLNVIDTGGAGVVFGYSGIRIPQTVISSLNDVANGATLDIRPAAGQDWVVTEISSEMWAGAGAPNDYPDTTVSLINGANLSELLEAGSVDTCIRWNSDMELPISRDNYLRITNVNGANSEIGVLGYLKRTYSS